MRAFGRVSGLDRGETVALRPQTKPSRGQPPFLSGLGPTRTLCQAQAPGTRPTG